jgi:uncharacterized protein YceK
VGCGTMVNLAGEAGPHVPFGGVQLDVETAKGQWETGPFAPVHYATAAYLFAVDTPLSAVGDCLTCPFFLSQSTRSASKSSSSPSQADCSAVEIPASDNTGSKRSSN